MKSNMTLTREQVIAIADRLDDVIGDHFYDSIIAEVDEEIEDADVYEIKKELALGYLEECTKSQKQIEYRSDVIAEIDDLNQYLAGNVTKMGLIEGLEGLLRTIRK